VYGLSSTSSSGMNPALPDDDVLDNPYTYTEYKSHSTHGARGNVFGEPSLDQHSSH